MRRFLRHIAALLLLPAVVGCGESVTAPKPLDRQALAAIVERPGVNREALARAVDSFFSDPAMGETRALLVLRDGKPVAERYARGYGPDTRLIGWSMSKTVTAAMIGQLVGDGRLTLDTPAPVPAWRQVRDPRGEITLRQLLQMRSGLRHFEAISPPYKSSEVRMLFLDGRDDMAKWAESQPLAAEPGSTFQYSTATTVILADIAARTLVPDGDAAARQRAVAGYLRSRLFGPAGLTSMQPEYDAAGTMIGGSMIYATARDWGRFGELLRNRGVAGGTPVIPASWVSFMLTPSPQDPAYGGHVWLNRKRPAPRDQVLFPGEGPSGVFSLIGHLGQYVTVVPSERLTIVRLGKSSTKQRETVRAGLARIVKLYD